MISKKSLEKDWIMGIREKSQNPIDPILIEKMILALMLLDNLQNVGTDFIFKGGTSLLLILGSLKRFSIDVDIIMKSDQNIDDILQAVIQQNVFHRFEKDQRLSDIPKCHYKLFFTSAIEMKESSILLDILCEENPYSVVRKIPIKSNLILNKGEPIQIKCPTPECLLGDKLTAFAPHTTGILYGKDKDLEIIKQLFDIGLLFNTVSDLKLIRETYNNVAIKEIAYRGLHSLFLSDVLIDTFYTAYLIGTRGFYPNNENDNQNEEFSELLAGIKKLSGYIFGDHFTYDSAILCASKAAYLTRLIKDELQKISLFDPTVDLSKLEISDHRYTKLNKIKKTSPEAFYYFYKSVE